MKKLVCLSALGALFVACGGGDKRDPDDAVPLTLEAYAKASEKHLQELLSCTEGVSIEAGHSEYLEVYAMTFLAKESVAKGYGSFQPAEAERCLDLLSNAVKSCKNDEMTGFTEEFSMCVYGYGVFKPLSKLGEGCLSPLNCVEGFCKTFESCEGVCTAFRKEGESCNSGSDCEEELTCAWEDGESFCRRLVAKGEPCNNISCANGLECKYDDEAGTNICQDFVEIAVGESCEQDRYGCVGGSFCNNELKCQKLIKRGEECFSTSTWNSVCEGNLSCVGALNVDGEYTRAGTCLPLSDKGGSCKPDSSIAGCKEEFFCDEASSTCLEYPAKGEACEGNCRAGLYCLEGKCETRVGLGEACESNEACRYDLICVDGTCAGLSLDLLCQAR